MLNKAVIDLNVLRQNALAVKAKLKKGVKFNAVVKANAYGHGAEKVASALYSIVDGFCVALVEEGINLRISGIDKQILVLTPVFKQDLRRAVYYNLTLTVESVEQVLFLEQECERQNRRASVHVKFNSGMNRFGVSTLKELKCVLDTIKSSKHVVLDGFFTHLACPQNKKETKSAQNKFLLANNLVKGYNNKVISHISASGGFLSGVESDMVRIGILLYGYKPFESETIMVKPVMRIFAPVIKKVNLTRGESALYGNCCAQSDVELSHVRYGYADGLMRAPCVNQFNNRCMDMTSVMDTGLSKWVCVMDDAEKIARNYGTISYEILTKSAVRAEKIYLN